MDIGIISTRYARALLDYADSKGSADVVYEEFCVLSRSFCKHPELRVALENPVLSSDEKLSLICTAAVGDGSPDDTFIHFMKLLLKHRREKFLQYIALTFQSLYRKSRHVGVVKLTTAVPVSKEMSERIRNSASSLLHARMELLTEVDPSIEGGFIFDINDYRLDASIATQLKKVKQQFIDKNRRIV